MKLTVKQMAYALGVIAGKYPDYEHYPVAFRVVEGSIGSDHLTEVRSVSLGDTYSIAIGPENGMDLILQLNGKEVIFEVY